MKVKMRVLALLLVCALLLPATVLAQPPVPLAYSGTVTIDGNPAGIGTRISAEIGGTEVASTDSTSGITIIGMYGLSIPWNASNVGRLITFKVGAPIGEVGGTDFHPAVNTPVVLNLAVTDTTGPTVTGAPTGSSEAIDTVVTATFDEPMNAASAQGAFSIAPTVAGAFSWIGNVMTFDPTSDLDYDTRYTVTISVAAQDIGSNPLARAESWSFTTVKGPYITVAKAVSPTTIGKKNSGLAPEISRVTLTANGAGPNPSVFVTNVVVTDVLPSYINLEGSFSTIPNSQVVNPDGTTTLTWNVVGNFLTTSTWTVSFDISADTCGRVLANEYSTSNVAYLDAGSAPVTEVFPKTYVVVRCVEDDVDCVVELGTPAEISIQNVYVNPEQAVQNQQVEVWVSIGNSGGTEGTKTVSLYVNGVYEDSQTVSVGPGGGENVLFWVSRAVPGTYTASVEGREAQFTVLGMGPPQSAPAPPMASAGFGGGLGMAGIIAIIVVVLALGVGLVVILRREST